MIKNEINKLIKKKNILTNNNSNKETKVNLNNCIDKKENINIKVKWEQLDRKTKRDLIKRFIEKLEITRDEKYNIEITNIIFTEEFITNNNKDFIDYINSISKNLIRKENDNEKESTI